MDRKKWLTDCVLPGALRNGAFGEGKTTVEFVEDENFKSQNSYATKTIFGILNLGNSSDNTIESKSVVIKLLPDVGERFFPESATFINEVTFYDKMIPFFGKINPSVDDLFPKFYYGTLVVGGGNGSDEYAIVIENLTARGFRLSQKKAFLDFAHLKLMFAKLGELHAYSYAAKHYSPVKFARLVTKFQEANFILNFGFPELAESPSMKATKALMDDPKYGKKATELGNVVQDYYKYMSEVILKPDQEMAVLCHGDYLRNNVLFKYDVKNQPIDMKIFDLATARYGSPVIDLSLCLYMNTNKEMRQKHFDDLMHAYHNSMKHLFPDVPTIPSMENILKEFRLNAISGFIAAAYFLFPMMMEDQGQEFVVPDMGSINWDEIREYPKERRIEIMEAIEGYPFQDTAIEVIDVVKDVIDRGFI